MTIIFTWVEFEYKNNENQNIPSLQRDQRISSWTNWNRPHIYIQQARKLQATLVRNYDSLTDGSEV